MFYFSKSRSRTQTQTEAKVIKILKISFNHLLIKVKHRILSSKSTKDDKYDQKQTDCCRLRSGVWGLRCCCCCCVSCSVVSLISSNVVFLAVVGEELKLISDLKGSVI